MTSAHPTIAKQTLTDNVLFRLPRDKELLFASSVILQKWINNYDYRMSINDVSNGRVKYQLKYAVDVVPEDWDLLMKLGLRLETMPVEGFSKAILDPDVVFDFSDERLLKFQHSGKHAYQVCGMMCGEDGEPYRDKKGVMHKAHLPELRKYDFNPKGDWTDDTHDMTLIPEPLTNQVTIWYRGFVMPASWKTYVLAAMGIPVIEILPEGRPMNWLSKWASPLYRLVDPSAGNVERQIENAKKSIEDYLCRSTQEAAGAVT